jgi:hypothetical protein
MQVLRLFSIATMALAVMSCGLTPKVNDAVGCYDVRQDPPGPWKWPPLHFTDQPVDYQNHHWSRIVSLDSKLPLTAHSLWREDGDVLYVYFGPDDFTMSDNYGSAASLQTTERGYSGQMQTVMLGTTYSKIDLVRRPCELHE